MRSLLSSRCHAMGLALLALVRAPDVVAMEKVRVEYAAPPECPEVATFKSLVGSRLTTAWEAEPTEFARRVVVQVSRSEGGYSAKVELTNDAGELAVKTVNGTACLDVVDGIALATALAIQSQGEEAPDSGAPSGAAVDAETPEEERPPPPVVSPVDAVVGRGAKEGEAVQVPAVARARTPLGLRVTARGALASGVGPNAAVGAALGLVLERRTARLGLSLEGLRTARTVAGGAPARFERLSARLEACPLALDLAPGVSIEPCSFADVGTLKGEAFDAPPDVLRGARGRALWLSAGGLGRVVGSVGWLVLEAGASAGFPLWRERFYIERGNEVHRVPAWYVAGTAGVGVRF